MKIGLRKDYSSDFEEFNLELLPVDPVNLFSDWYQVVVKSPNDDAEMANACCLTTVSDLGRPRSRWVLLREFGSSGFLFYTNYQSDKAKEITGNSAVSLNFYWPAFHRQIRIEGKCQKVDAKKSDKYFYSRPFSSQISAAISDQSQEVTSRQVLVDRMKKLTEKYNAFQEVPRPPHWGGYLIEPDYYEFWQGRKNRLHERVVYSLSKKADEITEESDGEDGEKKKLHWAKKILQP